MHNFSYGKNFILQHFPEGTGVTKLLGIDIKIYHFCKHSSVMPDTNETHKDQPVEQVNPEPAPAGDAQPAPLSKSAKKRLKKKASKAKGIF